MLDGDDGDDAVAAIRSEYRGLTMDGMPLTELEQMQLAAWPTKLSSGLTSYFANSDDDAAADDSSSNNDNNPKKKTKRGSDSDDNNDEALGTSKKKKAKKFVSL